MPQCHTIETYWSAIIACTHLYMYDLDLWPLTLKTASAMPLMTNICASFIESSETSCLLMNGQRMAGLTDNQKTYCLSLPTVGGGGIKMILIYTFLSCHKVTKSQVLVVQVIISHVKQVSFRPIFQNQQWKVFEYCSRKWVPDSRWRMTEAHPAESVVLIHGVARLFPDTSMTQGPANLYTEGLAKSAALECCQQENLNHIDKTSKTWRQMTMQAL